MADQGREPRRSDRRARVAAASAGRSLRSGSAPPGAPRRSPRGCAAQRSSGRSARRRTAGGSTRPAAPARFSSCFTGSPRRLGMSGRTSGAGRGPSSVNSNERRSSECDMPRDLRIDRWRPPCSPGGALRSRIQVSMSDDTPTSMSWRGAAARDQVGEQAGDVRRLFRKSISRITMLLTSSNVPPVKLDNGSTTTTDGLEVVHFAMHRREMELEAVQRRPRGVDAQQALLHPAIQVEADRSHVAARTAPAIPRTESRGRARRAGRRRPGSGPPGWSSPCRRRPRTARCWRGSSPCRRTCRPASPARSRPARRWPREPAAAT